MSNPNQSLVINPQKVAEQLKPDGSTKLRRCDNLILLNAYQASMAHSLMTLRKTIPQIVKQHDKIISLDIKTAYYELYMHPSAHKYLCFRQGSKLISARVLLFGLKPATFWFTKINFPAVRFFRTLLISLLSYIDDWLFADNAKKILELLAFALFIIQSLGWSLNEKCHLSPTTSILALGMLIDSECQQFRMPLAKMARVKTLLRGLRLRPSEQTRHSPNPEKSNGLRG